MKPLGMGMKIWPYLYVAAFVVMGLWDAGNAAITAFFRIYVILGLILSICYVAAATRKRNPAPYPDLAELNRGIKLWNLPCDLLVWGFLLVKLIHSGFAGYGLGIMVVFMFGIPYGITRLFMLWSAVPVCKEALRHAVRDRRISLAAANWHIFLHFLPIADIISGVSVARALRPTLLTTGEE